MFNSDLSKNITCYFVRKSVRFILTKEINKCKALLTLLAINPYQNPLPYEKLVGDLKGCFSRRVNIQHRLVYEIFENEKIVKILRMWTHYE